MRMRRPAAMLFDLLTGDESLGRRGGGAGRGADQRGPLAVPVFPTNWIGPASAGGSATDSAMVSSIERSAPHHRQPPRSKSNGIANVSQPILPLATIGHKKLHFKRNRNMMMKRGAVGTRKIRQTSRN